MLPQQNSSDRLPGHVQGLTNPLSDCPGQAKIFAGQIKYFVTCPEKYICYMKKTQEFQHFVAEAPHGASTSNVVLSSPDVSAVLYCSHTAYVIHYGWMDDLRFFVLFNCVSGISG